MRKCTDCKCLNCANNIANPDTNSDQLEFLCFNCDDCMDERHRKSRTSCKNFIITDKAALEQRRKSYKIR